jgi:hypothetical protein
VPKLIIESGKQKLEVELEYGKLTDTVSISAPPLGNFVISGKSGRELRNTLNGLNLGD